MSGHWNRRRDLPSGHGLDLEEQRLQVERVHQDIDNVQRSLDTARATLMDFAGKISSLIRRLSTETKELAKAQYTHSAHMTDVAHLNSKLCEFQSAADDLIWAINRVQDNLKFSLRALELKLQGAEDVEGALRRSDAMLKGTIRVFNAKKKDYQLSRTRVERALAVLVETDKAELARMAKKVRAAERSRTFKYAGGWIGSGCIALAGSLFGLIPGIKVALVMFNTEKIWDKMWEPYERQKRVVNDLKAAQDAMVTWRLDTNEARVNLMEFDREIQPAVKQITVALASMEELRKLQTEPCPYQ